MSEVAGHRAELRISFGSQVQHRGLQIHVHLKHTTRRDAHTLHTGIQMKTHACAYFTIQTHTYAYTQSRTTQASTWMHTSYRDLHAHLTQVYNLHTHRDTHR